MLTKKIPFYSALLCLLSGILITLLWTNKGHDDLSAKQINDNKPVTESKADNALATSRQKGYSMINPLLSVNLSAESNDLATLKASIQNLIDDDKRQGVLTSASVYLCRFSHGDWISINPEESYRPGSLMKVLVLMDYLKESEANSQLLSKKLTFEKAENLPVQSYKDKSIEQGHSYTVKELLHYMIAYSDNNATNLLYKNADLNSLKKVFTDLNIAEPNLNDMNYQISARNFSEFLTILYNATYLSKASSEYAMELLSECDFKDGMLKDVPTTVKVAHKYGEWGDIRMNIHELHESGIFYLDNKPYLLTVMTRGNSQKELGDELSKISKLVYDHISAPGN